MPSILYINGRFFSNIDELKNIFSRTIEPTSTLADEIYDAYCSGAFHSWLKESEDAEGQKLFDALPKKIDISNSELLAELSKLFAGKVRVINKPTFGKYAQFGCLMYGLPNDNWKTLDSGDAIHSKKHKEHCLKAHIRLFERINENYTMELLLVGFASGEVQRILSTKTINLNTDEKDLYVEFDSFVAPEDSSKEFVIDLRIEGELVYRIPVIDVWGKSIKMVFVKGSDFVMGAQGMDPSKANFDSMASYVQAYPVERTSVQSFYISKYPVTVGLWNEIMDIPISESTLELPIVNVSYNEVLNFIKRLNYKTGRTYRLPTEQEWEYAARGGLQSQRYKYSGSNNIKEVAWFKDPTKTISDVSKVGQKKANELGIFDMTGNVWEWCDSPQCTSLGMGRKEVDRTKRVVRGGSFTTVEKMCIVYCRDFKRLDSSSNNVGFRLAISVD